MQLLERNAILLSRPFRLEHTYRLSDKKDLVRKRLADVAVRKHGDSESVGDVPLVFYIVRAQISEEIIACSKVLRRHLQYGAYHVLRGGD